MAAPYTFFSQTSTNNLNGGASSKLGHEGFPGSLNYTNITDY
jgi:hypothetical protein